MSNQQAWTILSLLNWTTEYFTKNEIPTPRLDAEVLLAHLLKLERVQLYLQFDRPLTPEELTNFKLLIQRRVKGEPVSYIRGLKEFWSLSLKVGPGVLVPRPDTEVMVETVKNRWKEEGAFRFLDIGTGSGNLPIALAQEFPQSSAVAVDISEDALHYARENAEIHGVADRIQFLHLDFMKDLSAIESPFDLIVSNPPYIAKDIIQTLGAGVKDFEPHSALDGGADGLDFYRRISECVARLLKSGGLIVVEIGEEQGEVVQALFEKAGLTRIQLTKDYSGLPRVVSALMP